jgi:hypothetical protein
VARFAALQGIDGKAWSIVTTVVRDGACPENKEGTDSVTAGTFTERLLRVLPPLSAEQRAPSSTLRQMTRGSCRSRPKIQ